MLLEIQSVANFLTHICRNADEISEQQLCLLKDNIKQALFSYLINHWDTNIGNQCKQFNIVIRKANTNVDAKIQHSILHSYIKLKTFANYFSKGLEIQISQGNVTIKSANLSFKLFSYLGPPIPWTMPICTKFYYSKYSKGEVDKIYRKERNFKYIQLQYYDKHLLTEKLQPNTVEYFIKFLISWP